jgi:hypothetical protein
MSAHHVRDVVALSGTEKRACDIGDRSDAHL